MLIGGMKRQWFLDDDPARTWRLLYAQAGIKGLADFACAGGPYRVTEGSIVN